MSWAGDISLHFWNDISVTYVIAASSALAWHMSWHLTTLVFSNLDAHLCFSRNRYKVLMRALRFDDREKRSKTANNKWVDKFVHMREVYNIFATNCQNNYNPNKCLTIDEMLLPFRGRCSFRMFIPSKAAKYGIKIFCMVDPKAMYLVNSSVYLGKSNQSGDKNLGEQVKICSLSLLIIFVQI